MASKEPETEGGRLAGRWIEEINLAESGCEIWWRSGDVIIRRYKHEDRNGKGNANAVLSPRRRFAILWSNVQTIGPAIYAKPPVPAVTRRFRDEDPVAKLASEVLERSLSYTNECSDLDGRLQLVRLDYLLPGRGQVWLRYVPHMERPEPGEDVDLSETEDANEPEELEKEEPGEVVAYEEVAIDHVDWKDFLTNPARTWAEVRWVARRVLMDRKQLVARFGEQKGNQVPLDWSPRGYTDNIEKNETVKRAQVYEIWDKTERKAYWLSKAYTDDVLDQRDDPLKLKNFFPCPEPILSTKDPKSVLPVPDYILYQDQAEELDELTGRIGKLQDALRLVGFYAGQDSVKLQNVFSPGNENRLIPIDTYDAFKEAGGVKGMIEWVPLGEVIQALKGCYEARSQVISDIYQITGLSDIIRGDGDPNETATAQGIKAQWGSLRVRDRQKEFQRFARDIIRMQAEIIAEHFGVDTLKAMTSIQLLTNEEKQQLQMQMQAVQAAQAQGVPVPPEMQPDPKVVELMQQPSWDDVMALLKSDSLRTFRIEVETDSTIEPDETAQKQAFVEFTNAATGLLTAAAGIVPAAPYVAPLFAEMFKEGARLFRVSRGMEDTIDKVFSQAEQMPPAQPPQEQAPQSDPNALEAEKIKGQVAMVQAQNEQQRTQMEGQLGAAELQLKGQEIQLKAQALARDPNPQGTA